MTQPKNINLPSKKSVEDALRVFEGFRELCRHQLDVGTWATVDFLSKHHLNRLLQFDWRSPTELNYAYGEGLTKRIRYELMPAIKGYAALVRSDKPESHGQKVEG